MVLPQSVVKTLSYSDKFDYPLNLTELWLWQIGTTFPLNFLKKIRLPHKYGYSFLPGRQDIVDLRISRLIISQRKIILCQNVVDILKRIPTIEAIFLTGSLAMFNSPFSDDIDLMIITKPNSLWITRFVVVTYLSIKKLRRPPRLPEHSSPRVSNKICDNLYLDSQSLFIEHHLSLNHSLYLSHEILQAKPLFDRGSYYYDFLISNSWTQNYLPVAYQQFIREARQSHKDPSTSSMLLTKCLYPLNILFYFFQKLYMLRYRTTEKINPHFAFFHPNVNIHTS